MGCMECLQVFVVIFTIINKLLGLAEIVCGGLLLHLALHTNENSLTVEIIKISGIILISLGVGILITSLLGCSGAITRNSGLLITFVLLLLVLIGCDIYAIYKINEFMKENKENFTAAMTYKAKEFDSIQTEFGCCGVDGPKDYRALGRAIPSSCCPGRHRSCSESNAYYVGCYEQVYKMSGDKSYIFYWVIIGFLVFKVLQVILAPILLSKQRKPTSNVFIVQQPGYPAPVQAAPHYGPPAYASAPPVSY